MRLWRQWLVKREVTRPLYVFNLGLALLFAAAFAVLTLAPQHVERHVGAEVIRRIANAALERYPHLGAADWSDGLAQRLQANAKGLRELRDSARVAWLARIFASFCSYTCDDTTSIAGRIRERLAEELRELDLGVQRARDWAKSRYDQLLRELIRDLSIFTSTNAVLCLLAAVAVRRGGSHWVASAVAAILSLTALLGAWFYVFGQNWFQTLLFADYVGYAYLLWVALIGGALADIVFNEARVLHGVLNAVPVPTD